MVIWGTTLNALGYGTIFKVMNKAENLAIEEARSHPNEVVGAWKEEVTIPINKFMFSIPFMLLSWSPPIYVGNMIDLRLNRRTEK